MCQGTIVPRQINCNAINVRTGFLDPANMGKDTKIAFLSQILRKLWGVEYLAHLAKTAILLFAYMTEKLLKGAGVVEWHICQVQVNTNNLFHCG